MVRRSCGSSSSVAKGAWGDLQPIQYRRYRWWIHALLTRFQLSRVTSGRAEEDVPSKINLSNLSARRESPLPPLLRRARMVPVVVIISDILLRWLMPTITKTTNIWQFQSCVGCRMTIPRTLWPRIVRTRRSSGTGACLRVSYGKHPKYQPRKAQTGLATPLTQLNHLKVWTLKTSNGITAIILKMTQVRGNTSTSWRRR